MATEVQVPTLGESITEGTLAQWLKKPGEAVAAAPAVAFSSIRAMAAPTATVSPSATSCSVRTPATGAGTSTLTLSVSRLAIGSSAATASPGFFSHCASVPSVIDSPSVGT